MATKNAIEAVRHALASACSVLAVMLSAAWLAKDLRWCAKTKRFVSAR